MPAIKISAASTKKTQGKPAVKAKSSRRKSMCLVVLQDRKDTYLKLVTPEVFDWIHLPFRYGEASYEEEVPEDIRDEYFEYHGETTCRLSVGSYDNDRAQSAPGASFQSVVDAMQYAAKNRIDIIDEYHGYRY